MDITAGDDSNVFMIKKKVNIDVGLIIDGYGVMSGFEGRKRPPVNRASQVRYATLNQLGQEQTAEAATHHSCCSLSGSVELQSAVEFSKTCLKHRSV